MKSTSCSIKLDNHSDQNDSRRRREVEHNDDEYEEEAQVLERGKIPRPAWMIFNGVGANLS